MKLDDIKADPARFASREGKIQAERPSNLVVQVQLKEPIEAVGEMAVPESNFAFTSPSGVDLSRLSRVFQSHRLIRAEHSFRSPVEAHRRRFVNLHFPPDTDQQALMAQLRELPEVERAVVMPKPIPPRAVPTDPLVGNSDQLNVDPTTGIDNEWYIFRCHADGAWASVSGRNVIIADIDFGFRVTHQDLTPNLDLTHAHNSVDGSQDVSAGVNTDHGTGVLGIAAAASNGVGMAGFAFGATVWPIQANAGNGSSLSGDAFANAIAFVTEANAGGRRVVINLEVQTDKFGNYEMVPAVNTAIKDAIAKGIVVCVAAGNGSKDASVGDDGQPIPPTGSILVGATAFDPVVNQRASFSNFGTRVVVSAPGDPDHDVTCSNSSDDAYRNGFGGTSGATPKVSGTVALMLEANPSLTHDQVKQLLTNTGSPIPVPDGNPIGVFLNSAAAVAAAAALRV